MSTYIKTAAMSLLSRTLQSFLSKYLSDVDVEGVALPSVYDGSGWGVRLSNVKLREGVQLMKQMPGKVTKKRKRRRKIRKVPATRQPTGPSGDAKSGHMSHDVKTKHVPSTGNKLGHDDSSHPRHGKDAFSTSQGSGPDDGQDIHQTVVGTEPTEAKFIRAASEGGDPTGFYSDDEIDYDSEGVARPSTPVQGNKSFLSCFYKSNSSSGIRSKLNDNSLHLTKDDSHVTKRMSEPVKPLSTSSTADGHNGIPKRQLSAPATGIQSLQYGPTSKEDESSSPVHYIHSASTSAAVDPTHYGHQNIPPELPLNSHYKHQHMDEAHQGEDSSSILGDDYEEEEYEEEYELPVRLCLGEGGRIGTLDVRLIGKELHVMVEDAVVTIEAIPILEPEQDEMDHADADGNDASVGGGSRRNVDGSQHDASTSASDAGSSSTASKKKAEPKRDTVGDRVLADNPLARLISSIPHLFLRDIRVRFIVRDHAMSAPQDDSDKGATASTETSDRTKSSRSRPSPKDTMVEVGIDFLSVTSGDDVLSHFSEQVDDEYLTGFDGTNTSDRSSTAGGQSNPPPLLSIPSYGKADFTVEQTNEYLVRHVRSGRGPSAGIFVQIFGPDTSLPSTALSQNHVSNPDSSSWARQNWMLVTEYHFLRCSGVDIRARIHLGTKKVDAGYSWFYGEFIEEEGTDYDTMMLFGGMDTVAPGPQLPLPPMEPRMSRGSTPRQETVDSYTPTYGGTEGSNRESIAENPVENMIPSSIHPGADVYVTDQNGIQSCRVPSLFHRVSRGMEPKTCKECQHLPSGVCDLCWGPSKNDVKESSDLDLSLPMPGLTLQIGFRDPLEINVDRSTLESIGLVKSLFMKPSLSEVNETSEQQSSRVERKEEPAIVNAAGRDEATQATTSSTGFFSGILYGRSKETVKDDEPSDAFSTIMVPEKITVMGIYASEIALRIHVMREDKRDRGLSFCYWNLDVDCLTIDRQTLNAPEKVFQDVQLDVGRLICDEFRGTGRKNIVTLGLEQPLRRRCDSQSSKSSMIDDHDHNKTPWPSTACALLDIPPPLESLIYKSRERHGLQFRFVSLASDDSPDNASKSLIHLRLGVTDIDIPWAVRTDINLVIKEMMDNVVRVRPVSGRKRPDDRRNTDIRYDSTDREKQCSNDTQDATVTPQVKSLMTYTIQIDGGKITISPLIDLKLPLTKFSGERSSESGIFFETVLEKLELAYGSTKPTITKKCLSLPQIARLPESARMHILLCLKDISALEKALFVKKEKNSFRRIKAVDKGILRMAKKISKRDSKGTKKNSNHGASSQHDGAATNIISRRRRQHILSEIMKLDDSELTELWTVHQRYQRKLAKKRDEE